MKIFSNPYYRGSSPYCNAQRDILSLKQFKQAQKVIHQWPGYQPTPLIALKGLASELAVSKIWYKDEANRFGLGSFKALGGAYAVYQLLLKEINKLNDVKVNSVAELRADSVREHCALITVTCATAGNHGRSVAWGAQLFGARCIIYVPAQVSQARCQAIERSGAKVIRVSGNYDDSVRRAAADAAKNNWHVVSDTSYAGYTDIPKDVMQGYTVMVDEAMKQLPNDEYPTHFFIQGGVGGLAAAVCAHIWECYPALQARFIIVEPEHAACLYASAVNNQPTLIQDSLETVMGRLACGEVSTLAWDILAVGASQFVTIPDKPIAYLMRRLATGEAGDPPINAGECAVAGLCALTLARENNQWSSTLGLNTQSKVMLFGTEGASPNISWSSEHL